MILIDTHCHFDWPDFDQDREQILNDCQQAGVSSIVVPAVAAQYFPRVQALQQHYPQCRAALGLHPLYLQEHRDDDLALLEQALAQGTVCALGEAGLDFFVDELREPAQRQRQLLLLEQQLALASRFHLPVLLHARRAHAELYACLKQQGFHEGGIVHAFSGSYEEARRYLDLGFCLGIGGAYTYPSAHRLRRVLKQLPLSSLVLETDAPDMAPAMRRGELGRIRNQPDWLADIASDIAAQLEMPVLELARICTHNARRILRLQDT